MSSEHEMMLHSAGLVVIKRRKLRKRGRFRFVERGAAKVLKRRPSRLCQFGRVGDLSKQTSPFNDHAVDVVIAEEIGNETMRAVGISVHGQHDGMGPIAVLRRNAVLEITGNRLNTESRAANNR